jgi:hypothetical protein
MDILNYDEHHDRARAGGVDPIDFSHINLARLERSSRSTERNLK